MIREIEIGNNVLLIEMDKIKLCVLIVIKQDNKQASKIKKDFVLRFFDLHV